MTPRAYETAKRLAVCPGATRAERESARRRVAEYEARKGKPAPLARTCGGRKYCRGCGWTPDSVLRSKRCGCTCHPRPPVPWWTLTIIPRSESPNRRKPLGNTAEFRQVLRSLKAYVDMRKKEGAPEISRPDWDWGWGCYEVPQETRERLERNEIAWAWFPDEENARTRWHPPPVMREAMKNHRRDTDERGRTKG